MILSSIHLLIIEMGIKASKLSFSVCLLKESCFQNAMGSVATTFLHDLFELVHGGTVIAIVLTTACHQIFSHTGTIVIKFHFYLGSQHLHIKYFPPF